MADPLDKTISELPVDASLDGSEIVPVVQNGNKRTTAGAIAALAPGTDLSYDPATRILSSSTGADAAPLPVVSSTVAGLVPPGWVSGAEAATLPHIHGNLAGIVYEHVRNDSGAAMAALVPYHVVGSQGDTDRVLIVPADPGTPGSMPASGILPLPLTANQDGHGALGGVLTGVNTAAWPSGTVLYVAVGGGLTDQPPAANVQSVAIVGRSHATTGTLVLLSSPSLARVAFTGAYGDLSGRPTLGTAAAADASAFATAAQGAKADSAVQPSALTNYVQTSDSRLTDAREWSAATVPQAEAEEGTATTRRAWTAQRVRQAVAAWWNGASTAAGRALVAAVDAAAQRTALGLGSAAQGGLSDAAPAAPAATASAGTSANVSRADHRHQFQPTDVMIPLGGPTSNLIVAATPVETVPYWPTAMVLTGIPVWMVSTAPTGNPVQVDIRVGGTSIFSTLPTIAAGENNSTTAPPAVFSTAFTNGGNQIALGASVTFHVLQIGATVPGAGLKVALPARRAA